MHQKANVAGKVTWSVRVVCKIVYEEGLGLDNTSYLP